MADRIRIGVVGASAQRGWAMWSHLPALASLPDYEISAVAASTPEKSAAAARRWGAARSFTDPHELIESPDVDLVTIAVVLPSRVGLVQAAAAAGKHIYCEWPLAGDGTEAGRFLASATAAGVRHAVGLQTRHHPAIQHLRDLIADGWAGDILSASLTYSLSTPQTWPKSHAPMIGTPNLSRLVVVGGHATDLFRRVVGDFAELSATLATRLPVAVIAETGEHLPISTPDQILVTGSLTSGAVASVHITTGSPAGSGYRFEVHGTAGRLLMMAGDDSLVGPDFTLYGSQSRTQLRPIVLPPRYLAGSPDEPVAVRNVRQVYGDLAEAIRSGAPLEPDFATGLQVHQLLDTIELAALSGQRQTVS
ncbi:Gfo/Idh/MocA family protein [Frankia sp. CiP3]|uniref:Gfo/Idh/MocA family protein n=1 Tax=Frankia sp. CiP3 TaxID=2880971 RepID=UPI001EF721EC|nr:Gfo/Idh/MocA family oxidoreductase [Frankia sp. CiP3]